MRAFVATFMAFIPALAFIAVLALLLFMAFMARLADMVSAFIAFLAFIAGAPAFIALMAPAGFFIFSPMQPALANQSAKSIQKPGMIAWLSRASYPTRSPDSANTSQVSSEVHDGPRKELGLGFKCAALDFVDWGWGHLALWLWVGLVGHVFTVWLRTVPHSHARLMSARQDQGEAPTPQNPKPTKTEPAIAAALHPRRTSCRPPSPASEANVLDAT